MDNLLAKLCDNLEEQLATYKLLINYGKDKRDILLEGRLDELESIVKKEQNAVFQNSELEQHRMKLVSSLAEQFEEEEELNMTRIIELSSGQERNRLQKIYRELEEVVTELRELNQQNNNLIEQSLSYINYSLDILSGPGDDPGTYTGDVSKDAGKAKQEKRSFLDHKI